MNTNEFIRNSSAHTAEELAPFEDQHVAWSADGKRILAHAPTLPELYQQIDAQGITGYVIGFIPADGVHYFGAEGP
jgi:hypothetical protein